MANKAFLETTALYELCFLDLATQKKVEEALGDPDQLFTSQYVVFELARGALRNLILLQRKACQVSGFSELIAYASRSFRAPHRAGTCLGSFEAFFVTIQV
jgi:predicted nucleic acid-binding protein